MRAALAVAVALVVAGCVAPEPRFADRPPLWHDPDEDPVPVPHARPSMGNGRFYWGMANAAYRPGDRVLALDFDVEAVNVNALDELPESSWWVDPRRDPAHPDAPPRALSPAELARGAGDGDAPRPPYRIVNALSGGSAPGFVILDALDRRWAFKLDPVGHPGLITSTAVVTSRLAWASGWRVPADQLIDVARSQLLIASGATRRNRWNTRRALVDADVDATLAKAPVGGDGRWRVVASRWVEGKLLGPFTWRGRDKSDLNDRFPHEDRRDLRGFGVWAAWVDDVDVIENNTLDSYVGAAGRGHVLHYQLDVDGSFGEFAAEPAPFWMGHEPYFRFSRVLGALFTLGALPFGWEDERRQQRRRALLDELPELGGFDGEGFDPRHWHAIVDVPPFQRQTRRDRYWGAKRVAAFSDDELRAVIATGRYRPAAAQHLFTALAQRRDAIARAWFGDVAPLDYFRVVGERLCFDDWWRRAGLGGDLGTMYRARQGERVVDLHGGEGCVALPPGDGYRIVRIAVRRPGERHFGREVAVHLVRDHVVGVLH